MPIYLRQSTASQEVPLGYFVDSTDGNTEKTALTIANTDIKIWKTGATTLVSKNSGGATHMASGIYHAVLDATDTDTIGPLVVFCHVSGALAVRVECCVLDETLYDWQFGTSAPTTGGALTVTSGRVNADITHIAGSAVSTSTAQLGVNIVNAAGTAWGSGAITAASIASDAITAAKIADNAIDAASIATGAITSAKFAAGAIDSAAIATGAIDADALATDAVTEFTDAMKTAFGLVTGTADSGTTTTMVDAALTQADTDFWKGSLIVFTSGTIAGQARLITGFTPASDTVTFAPATTQAVGTNAYIIVPKGRADVELWDGAAVNALASGRVDVTVGAMQSDTVTSAAIADDAITASKIADNAIDTASIATGAITSAKFAAGAITATVIATDAIDADAIAANAVTEIQAGLSTLTQANVRAAIGMASANLDTQISALPTASENASAVWNETTSGHTTVGTYGQALNIIRANTAQAGSSTTITLDASASATDDFYKNTFVFLTGGTGAGQSRIISGYVGSTKVATVSAWAVIPSSDSVFVILPFGAIPGATAPTAAEVADAVWDEATSGHTTAGSTGKALTDAGSAGDPWGTALPGAYGAGTAGKIIGDNLDALISSRVAAASITLTGGAVTVGAMQANTVTASAIAADAVTEIQAGLSTLTQANIRTALGMASANLDTQLDAVPTATEIADATKTAFGLTTGTADSGTTTTMVDAALTQVDTDFWKGSLIVFTSGTIAGQARLVTGFTPASDTVTFAPATTQAVGTNAYIIVPKGRADVELWDGAAVNALASGRVDVTVGAMQADTVTASAVAADAVTEIQSGLSTLTQANIRTAVGLASADLDTQLGSRSSQSSVDTLAGYVDTEIAAIKAKTDQLTFTVSNQVDANIQSVNDATITGNGQPGNEWGP